MLFKCTISVSIIADLLCLFSLKSQNHPHLRIIDLHIAIHFFPEVSNFQSWFRI